MLDTLDCLMALRGCLAVQRLLAVTFAALSAFAFLDASDRFAAGAVRALSPVNAHFGSRQSLNQFDRRSVSDRDGCATRFSHLADLDPNRLYDKVQSRRSYWRYDE